ncbi:membrane protein [Photobacterium aquae]|uniref:Membrane protein n=1 Tax=Photobacterium aquae TaxID=1195763 RepID=A0A0J1JUC0_9GAMM|nr:DUF2956 domain-containing protein [Photobacterium aquae]KLV05912.1 membrane protein [Photobacterium aquae]
MTIKKSSSAPSVETQQEALRIAKATQKTGQTKEQTKLIAQGIQHGIEQYKKQQKAKARERDKLKKKQTRDKNTSVEPNTTDAPSQYSASTPRQSLLPWLLLALSWVGFIAYTYLYG